MKVQYLCMVYELLDYEQELNEEEFIFVNSIKDHSELTDDRVTKLYKLYYDVFGDKEGAFEN